jgi:hypothetical protein
MVNALDYKTSVETATLILAIVGVSCVVFTSVVIMTMVRRQRHDIMSGRNMGKALLQLSLQLEAEERKTRHAVKNLASSVTAVAAYLGMPKPPDFNRAVKSLNDPPDYLAEPRPELEPGLLIKGLVEANELEIEEALGGEREEVTPNAT